MPFFLLKNHLALLEMNYQDRSCAHYAWLTPFIYHKLMGNKH